jgi:ubiquinone/menaquinone biosynthesis C-methylase UbiE
MRAEQSMTNLSQMSATDKASPQPGAVFHERIAHNWTAGYGRRSFKRRLNLFTRIFDRVVVPGQIWLDLGCGSGVLTVELLKRGASVVALDGAPTMIENARALVETLGENPKITFKLGDAQDLSWSPNSSFDGVLCSSVVEYVSSPASLLSELSRVLKIGGTGIISLPPALSTVRATQKIMRRAFSVFGQDKFTYLAVSRFEIVPSKLHEWFTQRQLSCQRITAFDPVIPNFANVVLRPALLVCELTKRHTTANSVIENA